MTEIGLEMGLPTTLMVRSFCRASDRSVSNHEGGGLRCIWPRAFWSPRGSRRPLRGLLTMRGLVHWPSGGVSAP